MAKKNKQVTSRGGNSFLTVKSGEDSKPKTEVHPLLRDEDENVGSKKSEEEKIEEFADNVARFLDKIDNLKSIFKSFFGKKYVGGLETLKMTVMKGKLKFLKPFLPLIIIVQKML